MFAALDPVIVAAITGAFGAAFAAVMALLTAVLIRRGDRKERAAIRKEVADAALATAEALERIDAQGEATHAFLNSQDTENKRASLLLTEGWLESLRAEQATRRKAGLRAQPGTIRQIKLLAAQVDALDKVIAERVAQGETVDAQVAAASSP